MFKIRYKKYFYRCFNCIVVIMFGMLLLGCGVNGASISPASTATEELQSTNSITLVTSASIVTKSLAATPYMSGSTPTTPFYFTSAPTPTPALAQDWQTRWLKGIPCKAPCWEGITPGKTTLEEAVNLLKQIPVISNVNLSSVKELGYLGIDWTWTTGDDGGYIWPELAPAIGRTPEVDYSNKPSDPVASISPYFSTIRVGEIIKAYGNPTYLMATVNPTPPSYFNQYYLVLIYEKFGFSLSLQSKTIPVLSANLEFGNLKFFNSMSTMKTLYKSLYSEKMLVEWNGFNDFQFYCRDKIGGNCKL